jgi:uncharacterized membrane protein
MSFAASISIDAPAERVWSVMTDVERWPEWTASISKVERLDHGPFGLGSRARITQPKLGRVVWTVTAFEPNRYFAWTTSAAGTTGIAEHQVSPGPGDSVSVTLTIRQTGLLAPLIALLTAGLTRRYLNMETQGLKRRVEAGVLVPAA